MPVIPFAKLEESVYPPKVNHEHDAGMDFYCQWHTEIRPYQQAIIKTGITVEIPQGFVGLLKPKGAQQQLVGSGVVEWTYQGEVMFRIFNATDQTKIIYRGDAIGQMIIIANLEPEPMEVDLSIIHAKATERGATGGIVQASSGQHQPIRPDPLLQDHQV